MLRTQKRNSFHSDRIARTRIFIFALGGLHGVEKGDILYSLITVKAALQQREC